MSETNPTTTPTPTVLPGGTHLMELTPSSKPKSVMIATPMYGGLCTGHYVTGLLASMQRLRAANIQVYWAHIMNESLITRGRNELVRIFLETEKDYLMFVDADIHFDGEAILKLIDTDYDVVCGIYPKKEVDWAQVKRAAKAGHEDLENFSGAFVMNLSSSTGETESDSRGCIEVRHGGTGFMLIKRQVFEFLKPHVPTYRTSTYKDPTTGLHVKPETYEFFATSIDHTGCLLSEDYHFCELWRKHGGKVYANPFIKLEHVGTYIFGGSLLRSGGNLK